MRRIVETYRPSHYLDGPDHVDYIFRNQALGEREQALYVDYVRDEDGPRWVSPSSSDSLMFGYLTPSLGTPHVGVRLPVGLLVGHGRVGGEVVRVRAARAHHRDLAGLVVASGAVIKGDLRAVGLPH